MFKLSVEWLKDNYEYYNKKYFENKLPTNIRLYINCKNNKIMGQVLLDDNKERIKGICLNNYFINNETQAKSILLHEMIHILLHIKYKYGGHDERFKNIAKILNQKENLKDYPITTSEYPSRLSKQLKNTITMKKYFIYIYDNYFIVREQYIKDNKAKSIYLTINPLIKFFDLNMKIPDVNNKILNVIINDIKTKRVH